MTLITRAQSRREDQLSLNDGSQASESNEVPFSTPESSISSNNTTIFGCFKNIARSTLKSSVSINNNSIFNGLKNVACSLVTTLSEVFYGSSRNQSLSCSLSLNDKRNIVSDMESISHAMNNSLTDFFIKIGYLADKLYISFLSMRYYFNNCIFNRAHLSDKAWRLSNIDLRSTIATLPMLSILQRYPLEYKRSHGGWEEVRFIGHIQSCEKIHATTKTNNGKAETKHGNRNHTLHKLYISFLSMRYYFNNCIFNRAHLSDKAWRLSNIDLRSTIATLPMLSILQRYPLEYKRSHGGWEEVRFIGHIQSCEKIHATTKTNNGKAETKHSNRNHTLLKLAKYFIQWYFNLLPGVTSDHSETLSPFSRNYNSVDILRQSQTLGTGVNTNTLFNDDDVMNPSSNDEAEEEDNSPRIVIGDYTLEEREKMVKDLFKNNPDYPHFQYSTSES